MVHLASLCPYLSHHKIKWARSSYHFLFYCTPPSHHVCLSTTILNLQQLTIELSMRWDKHQILPRRDRTWSSKWNSYYFRRSERLDQGFNCANWPKAPTNPSHQAAYFLSKRQMGGHWACQSKDARATTSTFKNSYMSMSKFLTTTVFYFTINNRI